MGKTFRIFAGFMVQKNELDGDSSGTSTGDFTMKGGKGMKDRPMEKLSVSSMISVVQKKSWTVVAPARPADFYHGGHGGS